MYRKHSTVLEFIVLIVNVTTYNTACRQEKMHNLSADACEFTLL